MGRLTPWVVGSLIAGLNICSWAVIHQLLRQQGRLLMRLDELEQRVEELTQPFAPAGAVSLSTIARSNGGDPRSSGLLVGTAIPAFDLPDLTGNLVGLADFRGRPVLLVHWNPACSFCVQIAPELARLQLDLLERNVQLLLVSHGDPAANRRLAEECGLLCPILLQDPARPMELFDRLGTPVAYLVDGDGRVAKPLAIGALEVERLAQAAAGQRRRLPGQRPLRESRIEREGLKAGTPAPTFSLPDLDGRMVALDDYRGRRLLLIFSDPGCGPCVELMPALVRLHRERRDDPALLMISRGDLDENRRKAREAGVDFPVVIQPQWTISKQYGIFATPVAFLIDERGAIARDVARGADEILALVDAEARAGAARVASADGGR
jgi:peroxiredoxin